MKQNIPKKNIFNVLFIVIFILCSSTIFAESIIFAQDEPVIAQEAPTFDDDVIDNPQLEPIDENIFILFFLMGIYGFYKIVTNSRKSNSYKN
ncbi:hypothetical protein [Flavobacterium sp.]|jgi:hypothetical protein|uniref:hypothetical protein n=1 Tax=Flavobacterium sp. TaxID=239 RepID=UPI0037BEC0FF